MSPERGRNYRALITDYGGVLTTSLAASFAAFCIETGANPECLRDALAAAYSTADAAGVPANDLHDLVAAVETGRIRPSEFDARLADSLSVGLDRPIDPANLTSRLFAMLGPDERMRRAIALAHTQGLKTGLISNTWGINPPDDTRELFDVVLLSGREGLRKPQPEIYLLAAARLRLPPEECVFVDDVPANTAGAEAVGMTGVLHRDASITIPRLEALLGLPLA